MPALTKPSHEMFSLLVAQGNSAVKAYALAGYKSANLYSCASVLRRNPKIAARIEEIKLTLTENTQEIIARERAKEVIKEERAIERAHIRNVESRVARQNATWEKLQRITEARAADALLSPVDVPGLETGLFTKVTKRVGSIVEERYELDTDLLTQINQVEDLTARELGQRAENQGTTSINIALLVPNAAADTPAPGVQDVTPRAIAGGSSESAADAVIDIGTTR